MNTNLATSNFHLQFDDQVEPLAYHSKLRKGRRNDWKGVGQIETIKIRRKENDSRNLESSNIPNAKIKSSTNFAILQESTRNNKETMTIKTNWRQFIIKYYHSSNTADQTRIEQTASTPERERERVSRQTNSKYHQMTTFSQFPKIPNNQYR